MQLRKKQPKCWFIKLVIHIEVHGMVMCLGREGNSLLKQTLPEDLF